MTWVSSGECEQRACAATVKMSLQTYGGPGVEAGLATLVTAQRCALREAGARALVAKVLLER